MTVAGTSAGESPSSSPLGGHGPTLQVCPDGQWVRAPGLSTKPGDAAGKPGELVTP